MAYDVIDERVLWRPYSNVSPHCFTV